MKMLVACEFSGIVRDAFAARGWDAWSCDLLPTERPGQHIQEDIRLVLVGPVAWDLVIAHPPCTHLASSGAAWFAKKRKDGRQQAAIDFFFKFTCLPCPWAIENPVGVMSRLYRKPTQVIQPWQFGHAECKKTCLWLNGLPPLTPTQIVEPLYARKRDGTPGISAKGKRDNPTHWSTGRLHPLLRAMARSRTYPGIAAAMALQWSSYLGVRV